MRKNTDQKAFTLIELLVVISIIGLLASIVLVSLNSARAKARDARRKADMSQMAKAIQIYYINHDSMPVNRNPCCGYSDSQANFLQELVDDGLLTTNPKSPTSPSNPYMYYDYGKGNSIGALLVTSLETGTPSTTGEPNTCRPWPVGVNWCDQSSSLAYCLCNPY